MIAGNTSLALIVVLGGSILCAITMGLSEIIRLLQLIYDLLYFTYYFYDLYIEIQGSWTHGPHPYDSNNSDDLILKNKNKITTSPESYINTTNNF